MESKRPLNSDERQEIVDQVRLFLAPILRLQARIRDAVVLACEQNDVTDLTQIVREEEGDTIYSIDRVSEELLVSFLSREIAPTAPIILIAEGLPDGQVVLPEGNPG